jgi:hypothetical protein
MPTFDFENKFEVADTGYFIYNLKIGRGFTKGKPNLTNLTNDVMINITQQQPYNETAKHSKEFMKELAEVICEHLNKTYTFENG